MSSPESAYEAALVSAVAAATGYIKTNSIPVRKYRDNSRKMTVCQVVIHAERANNTHNCTNPMLWDFSIHLHAVNHCDSDTSQSALDSIFEALQSIAKGYAAAPSTLIVSGFATHGVLLEPGDDLLDEKDGVPWQSQSIKIHVYISQT